MSTLKEKAEARRQQMKNILEAARAEAARRKQAKKAKSTGPPAPTKAGPTTKLKKRSEARRQQLKEIIEKARAEAARRKEVEERKKVIMAKAREVADKNQAARTTSTTTGVVSSPAPTSSAFTVPTTKSIFDSQAYQQHVSSGQFAGVNVASTPEVVDTGKGMSPSEFISYIRSAPMDDEALRSSIIRSAGDWHHSTVVTPQHKKDGSVAFDVDFKFAGADVFHSTKHNIQQKGFMGLLATAFTPSDPLGLKSAYYVSKGDMDKAWQVKVSGVADTRKPFLEFYLSSPMGMIGATAVTAGTVGAGLGAVSYVAPKVGLAAKIGLGGYGVVKTGQYVAPSIKSGLSSGDYGDLIGKGALLGLAVPTAIGVGKIGYKAGYGRTEQFIYGRATYKVGSPEYIRFKETLKVARHLEHLKSKDVKALDLTKDIMRLSPAEASKVTSYLKTDPKAVVGGSAAQYSQVKKSLWFKYRDVKPRDVDLLVKDAGVTKKVLGKRLTGSDHHKVDVHDFSFGGKAGKYLKFGFETKSPVKVGSQKFMRLGEQVVRKGTSSVMIEKQYRWFKDIPDFKMAAKQLIGSGKKSISPVTRFHAYFAGKHFSRVVKPTLDSSFGRAPSGVDRVLSGFAKKVYKPGRVVSYGYGYGGYSSVYVPPFIPSYKPTVSPGYKPSVAPSYKPTMSPGYSPSYTPRYTPGYKPSVAPSYKPTMSPGYSPSYTPRYTPGYKPYKPSIPTYKMFSPSGGRKTFIDEEKSRIKVRYQFRMFDVLDMNKILRGVKF
jgi:hypothetical protein